MIFPSNRVRVMVATKPIDFRKGHDSLAANRYRAGILRTKATGLLADRGGHLRTAASYGAE